MSEEKNTPSSEKIGVESNNSHNTSSTIVVGETSASSQYKERDISKRVETEQNTKLNDNILSRSDLRWNLAQERVESGFYAISATAAWATINSASQEETGTLRQAQNIYAYANDIFRAPLAVSDISNKSQLIYRPIKNSMDYIKGEELTYQTKKVLTYGDIRRISEKDPSIRVLLVGGEHTKVNLKFDKAIDELQKAIKSGKFAGEALQQAQERLSLLKQIKGVRNGSVGRRSSSSLIGRLVGDQLNKSTESGVMGLTSGVKTFRTTFHIGTRYVIPATISLTKASTKLAYRGVKKVVEKPATLVLAKGKKEVKKVIAKHPSLRRQQLRAQKTVKSTKKIISQTKRAVNGGIYNSVKSRFARTKLGNAASTLKKYYSKFISSPFKRFIGRPFNVVKGFVGNVFGFIAKPFNVFKMVFRKFKLLLIKLGAGAAVFIIGTVLVIQLMQTVTALSTSLIYGDEGESGKIDLSKFAEVLDKKDEKYSNELQKIVDKYDYVTFVDGYSTDNFREIVSMAAVYFEQDFEDWEKVKAYLNKMYDLSHSYSVKELPDTYCTGCKEKKYKCSEKGHEIDNSQKGGCKEKVIPNSETVRLNSEAKKGDTTIYNGETYTYDGLYWVNYYCNGDHKEKYCPGHSNAEITLKTLGFDELFEVDTSGSVATTPGVPGEFIDNFTITYYCCEQYEHICNAGPPYKTATGTTPTPGRTIAVDPDVIPLGSKVVIDGYEYIAEDTGGAINNKHIDIVVATHDEAIAKGKRQAVPVYYAKENVELSEEEKSSIENSTWDGWTEDNIEIVKNIYNQNWSELYEGWNRSPLNAIGEITVPVDANSPYYKSNSPFRNGNIGQCTWWAWGRANEVNNGKFQNLPTRSAAYWYDIARNRGYKVGKEPAANSIAVWGGGNYYGKPCGHVRYIEAFDGENITWSGGQENGKMPSSGNWDVQKGMNAVGTGTMSVKDFETKSIGSNYYFIGYIYLE